MEKNYTQCLYDRAKNASPYKQSKSYTSNTKFTPSWPKRQADEFKPMVIKQIGTN